MLQDNDGIVTIPIPGSTLRATYLKMRKQGYPASVALRHARTHRAWDELDYGHIGPSSGRTFGRYPIPMRTMAT